MKKFSWFSAFMGIASLAMIFSTGCNRLQDRNISDEESLRKGAMTEEYDDDASTIADQALLSTGSSMDNYRTEETGSVLSGCTTIERDSVNKKVTIHFGLQPDGTYQNCMCKDGKNRRGRIVVHYTGKYREAGTEINTEFADFFVNDNKMEGTKTVKNMGLNNAGNVYFTINVTGQITLAENGNIITWTSARQREWLAGWDTERWADDVYGITGTGSGLKADGNSYTMNISKQLIRKVECHQFVQGKMEFVIADKPTRTIDFGTGVCDNEAVVTVGRRSRTIQLRH
jgi:hypothetical protein